MRRIIRSRDGRPCRRRTRCQLWESLHRFAAEHEAKITSPMHCYPVRLETPPDSKLPDKLRELGYNLIDRGAETRIGPPMSKRRGRWLVDRNNGYSFYVAQIYEIDLPGRSDTTTSKTLAVQ